MWYSLFKMFLLFCLLFTFLFFMNLLLGNNYFIYVLEGQSHKTYGYSLITKHASAI